MILCVILSIFVISAFVLFYNKIFAVTFDENFANATGIDTQKYNLLIAIIIAIIVVLAMNFSRVTPYFGTCGIPCIGIHVCV